MAFYIYDPKGYRLPYHPDWRDVKRVEETRSSTEKESERQKRIRQALKSIGKPPKWNLPKRDNFTLLAAHIMKRQVQTLSPQTSIYDAWKFFCEHRFRHVPIVTDDGSLVGILSDRKLLREMSDIDPSQHHVEGSRSVNNIMITHVLTAHPATEVSLIAKIFINEKVGAMPIVDENDNLVGIITRSDILRTFVKIDDTDQKA